MQAFTVAAVWRRHPLKREVRRHLGDTSATGSLVCCNNNALGPANEQWMMMFRASAPALGSQSYGQHPPTVLSQMQCTFFFPSGVSHLHNPQRRSDRVALA